jgi:hypothetical protein
MKTRTPLDSLVGKRIDGVWIDFQKNAFVFTTGKKDAVLFTVHRDSMFDADGFYFDISHVEEKAGG